MTGFGRAQGSHLGWTATAEARSINHRGLDPRIGLPSVLAELEQELRRVIKARCGRGRIELRLNLEAPPTSPTNALVLERAKTLYETLESIQKSLSLPGPITLDHLLRAGLSTSASAEKIIPDTLADWVISVGTEAIENLVVSRTAEGASLTKDALLRLRDSEQLIDQIEALCEVLGDQLRGRLQRRLQETLDKLEAQTVPDDARVLQELAVYLEKGDITEEIVRARAHVSTLTALFEGGNTEGKVIGKRVDFFLQELGREANTMGSQSSDAALTEIIVSLKSQIERLREQAQNLE